MKMRADIRVGKKSPRNFRSIDILTRKVDANTAVEVEEEEVVFAEDIKTQSDEAAVVDDFFSCLFGYCRNVQFSEKVSSVSGDSLQEMMFLIG